MELGKRETGSLEAVWKELYDVLLGLVAARFHLVSPQIEHPQILVSVPHHVHRDALQPDSQRLLLSGS